MCESKSLEMLMYDLRFLGSEKYNGDDMDHYPDKIITDNEAAIFMAKWNKVTAENIHVSGDFTM